VPGEGDERGTASFQQNGESGEGEKKVKRENREKKEYLSSNWNGSEHRVRVAYPTQKGTIANRKKQDLGAFQDTAH